MSGRVVQFPAKRRAAVQRPPCPEDLRAALVVALEKVFDTAEHLMGQLDVLDGDADREDDGTAEPSLGAPIGGVSQIPWAAGGDRDIEDAQGGEVQR